MLYSGEGVLTYTRGGYCSEGGGGNAVSWERGREGVYCTEGHGCCALGEGAIHMCQG
jgi:hypothetical protein